MQEKREQKRELNKGFSLVELIVVIAIMAILVGVISTTFIRYVGRSQETANDANVKTLKTAADIALLDPALGDLGDLSTTPGTFTITWASGTSTIGGSLDSSTFKTALDANLDKGDDGKPVYPAPSSGDGTFTISVSGTKADGYTATVNFEAASTPTTSTP